MTESKRQPPKRRWLRFSLRAFFVALTLLCVAFAWYINRCERQRKIIARIKADGGKVYFANSMTSELTTFNYLFGDPHNVELHEVTDEILENVNRLGSLHLLNCADESPAVSERGFQFIAQQHELFDLRLRGMKIDSRSLETISHLSKLIDLELEQCELSPDALQPLQQLPELGTLYIRNSTLNGASFPLWAKLYSVDLSGADLSDESLQSLCRNTGIVSLNLGMTKITDVGLAHLCVLPRLKTLRLDGTAIRGEGISGTPWLALSSLFLSGSDITDEGLASFRSPALEWLELGDTSISDAGLKYVGECKLLNTLNLERTRISDAGLKELAGCAELSHLKLNDTAVGDAGMKKVAAMTAMSRLELANTQVGDEGLRAIGGMPNLWVLILEGTNVTDAGLKHLVGPELKGVSLPAKGVTPAGKAALVNQLKSTDIWLIDPPKEPGNSEE